MIILEDKKYDYLNIRRTIVMAAIASSFLGTTIKAVFFAVVAYAGIVMGKKFRDKKDAEKAVKA